VTPSSRCLACGGELAEAPAVVAPDRMHGIAGRWPVHECRRCGSGTTLPPAREEDLAAFYPRAYAPFDIPAGALARAMAMLQRARDRRFPLAELAAGLSRPGTLLDVGCGRGDLAASWVDAGWRVLGVEPSPEAAATAGRRGARIIGETLSTASLPPGPIDAVVFRHSLEHVVDPPADLRRVFDALRPGGRLAVIVPNWGSWQRRAFGEYWFPLELPRHRTHFTAAGLRLAMEGTGFEHVDVRPATPYITTTWSLQFRMFGRLVTAAGPALLAGYAASGPVALVSAALDARRGGGDFLHAAAAKPR
jgi:SAM-dependent methyltransferase